MTTTQPHSAKTWHDIHYRHSTPESNPGWWEHFEEVADPFNPANTLTGYVQRAGGNEYGSLVITHVNGREAPQRCLVTPKAAYPYHRDSSWLLHRADHIRSFVKYDGTNICQYAYQDAGGETYVTFKLRTRPILARQFTAMLRRCLERYPAVANLALQPGEAIIYELYGYQNPMLIRYAEEIELRVLCRRHPQTGDLEPAEADHAAFAQLDCPLAEPVLGGSWEDIEDEYRRRQLAISGQLTRISDELFDGSEGEMLYVSFPDGDRSAPGAFTRLIKLKPPEIEEIHQASDFVPKLELLATARNVFEVSDNPTLTDFIMLLSEDWSDDQIARSMETVERALAESLERRGFEDRVLEAYSSLNDPQAFHRDKAAVMRTLSHRFPKAEINKAYNALRDRLPPVS